MIRRFTVALGLIAVLAASWLIQSSAQSCGPDGAFLANQNYVVCGAWTFTQQPTFPGGGGTPVTLNGVQTLTNKTLTAPVLTTPTLGVATATSVNKVAITAPATSATLTVANGKTLTASNTLTLAGTDATVMTFPTTSATIARTDAANTFTGVQTMTSPAITTPVFTGTATGTYTLGGTPTITAPIIATISNTGTITLPSATGGAPVVLYCGSTGTGNQTCSATAAAATTKIYAGHSTLSSNAAVITFPVAFASTTYDCVANDITTRANPVQMISTSASTATITNTTGGSDVINWVCVGQ